MDETLKKKAYLEGLRLKNTGYDNEVIFARLEKQGIPEDIARQVIQNLSIQQKQEVMERVTEKKVVSYNVALVKIGIGVFLAIASYIIIPEQPIIPIGLILGGIIAAFVAKLR
ncbi:hypothetical protein ACFGVR_22640 [Mucilaginibacter sp. AW1-3]